MERLDLIYYILMAAGLAVVLWAWRMAVLSGRREKQENEAFKRHIRIVVRREEQ